ncbi:hypothetical protein [Deinococcus sp. KNUC1210]|uniref:hypothetical protein n=1 Tax=Deinococcus sp. KNUC1210 TaxID=2917691 RepID=UPI00351D0293
MSALLGWLKESGAVAYAQQVADDHAGRGLALLTQALVAAPQQQAAAQILALVSGLARREA